jgi:class 3 adenylate cyclase/tetratricopeptide (TPR) repeat protein
MPCTRCAVVNLPGARFCSACGGALEVACPHCGAASQPGQRFCSACGHDLATIASPAVDEGDRRHATVMFSDLSGYTAWNEAADPEDVETVMGRIKAEATAVIERHGGTVNQFVGDEIMALFGVPQARRDDPRHAVSAALDLHRTVRELIAGLGARTGPELRMHTGINTGLVVARRSDARAGDYVLTGDAVNTAARLRSLAEPDEVVVSAETWRQVADFFEADASAPIEVKGKEQPLVAYRVRRAREGAAAGGALLVGREEEQRDFRALAEACAERKRSRVVVVRGDPGVGKSRLVAEFIAAARSLGFSSHAAAVLDFGAETGRDAVRSLARSLLGVPGTSDEAARRDAIERASTAQPTAPERRLFLYDLLDVAPPLDLRALAAAISTGAREKGSLHALCDLATTASSATPLLLVVEDIHWADTWTLERLAALAVLAARQPLLLVMTTRFAGDPTAGAWRTLLHGAPLLGIDLGPLSTDESLRLALQASAMGPALVESCVERAEGNPLFLLQLLLNAGEAAQSNLPGSIQALVHTRMDRLAAADKLALQAAAVLGQRYTLETLRHLIDNEAYDCRLLEEHFLVRADGSEFLFCHALIRDGAYASLLHKRRRTLHARAAEWFATRDLALAAEHFDRANDARAAGAYLAASQALGAQFHHQAALALVDRGLAIAAEQPIRFALLMARGRLLVDLGRSVEAIDACRLALDGAVGSTERAQALIVMAAGMRLNDRIAEGLAALDEAEPLVSAGSLSLELARLHHLRGNLLFPLGRHVECLREHGLAREHARQSGSLEAEAAAMGGLGDGYYLQGRMHSAHQQFRDCVALARAQGFGRLEVANLSMIGWSGLYLAQIADAAAVGREAITLAQQASQPRAEIMGRGLVAWVDGVIRDRRDEAEDQTAAALQLIRALGARRFEAQMLAVNALLALRRGDHARGVALAEESLDICRAHGMGHIGPWAFGVRALLEPDPAARLRFLDEGERQLTLGCVSHNHVQLRELAIDALLEIGDWDGVDANCQRIRTYTADEPLLISEFAIGRGAALARFGRGERSEALRVALTALHEKGTRLELNSFVPALDAALARF